MSKPKAPVYTEATVNALLEKLQEVSNEKRQWAHLARLLLMKVSYEDLDPATLEAFEACYPESVGA